MMEACLSSSQGLSSVRKASPSVSAYQRVLVTRRVEWNGTRRVGSRRGAPIRQICAQAATATEERAGGHEGLAQQHKPANTKTLLGVILGGGAGSRLYPLTKERAKPAVPIAGQYRLIDIPISNCLNSGINKIFILTQYMSASLTRHINRTYNSLGGMGPTSGFVEVLPAVQTTDNPNWFQGTADAIRQYAWLLDEPKLNTVEDVLILSGDHLYNMDYTPFYEQHKNSGSDITIGCLPVNEEDAKGFGLMKVDSQSRIVQFAEKPKGAELKAMRVDTTQMGLDPETALVKPYLASMGIYIFKKDLLIALLRDLPDMTDFGGEIIPHAAKDHKVVGHLYKGYWEDIGTIRAFFDANLALVQDPPMFDLYDTRRAVFTSPRFLPPAVLDGVQLDDVIVSPGSTVIQSRLENALIGIRSRVDKGCTIRNAMVMGADYYESEEDREAARKAGRPAIGVGEGTTLENCIVDKNARIGKNVKITNKDGIEERNMEEQGLYIRSGIVVVLKNATIPDGFTI